MKVKNLFLLVSIVLLGLNCSHTRVTQKSDKNNTTQEVSTSKAEQNNISSKMVQGMLLGKIDVESLLNEIPVFRTKMDGYQPEPEAVSFIKNIARDIHVIVFLGTWCGDSKRNVPAFIKILESAQSTHLSVEYWGLDRTKVDKLGMTLTYAIKRVPTFIFTDNGKEFGRITENPAVSMEEDMADILSNHL